MRKVRVLVVDDSVVVRRMLSDLLSADPAIEVVGTAPNGSIALAKIPQLTPDVVTLDVEMPEMNGLDVLAQIRKTHRDLPVIMFSAPTERTAATKAQALALGATDFTTKPSQTAGLEAAMQSVREQLLPKIRAFGPHEAASTRNTPERRAVVGRLASVGVLAIGASTGGPNALAELFGQLPPSLPVPILIVQHMPLLFTKLLAERLTATCPFRFHEAKEGDQLEPGQAWIAPGDFHMRVVREPAGVRLALDQGPAENSCRPAVDVLFRSVAAVYGAGTLAVVLTGMGQDGLRGCEHISERGGQIVVQDQQSSVVWGMPGFVAKAGLAQAVLPLPEMARDLLRRLSQARSGAASRSI